MRSLGVDLPSDISEGIVPVVIAGTDVTRFIDASRPAIGAMRTDSAMPKVGANFVRPA